MSLPTRYVPMSSPHSHSDRLANALLLAWTDVVKTRMQLQTKAAVGADRYNGMMDAFRKIIATEG